MQAAGLQDRLWHLQEALYRNQGGENSGWVTDELVRRLAGEIPGLDVERLFVDAEGPEVDALLRRRRRRPSRTRSRARRRSSSRWATRRRSKVERPGLDGLAVALDDALGR